ncbi:hypothetical protein GCM10018784_47370 [Streptomyces hydrogenans]|nr:hypothetical protein GCM10018784_47370 [Streptomyces hydrogenans]
MVVRPRVAAVPPPFLVTGVLSPLRSLSVIRFSPFWDISGFFAHTKGGYPMPLRGYGRLGQ